MRVKAWVKVRKKKVGMHVTVKVMAHLVSDREMSITEYDE